MERKINLSPFLEVSILINYDHHSLNRMTSVIFQNESGYFHIEDELEKVYDVCQMPDYIKLDWINYNKKSISIPVINKHIAYYTKLDKKNKFDAYQDSYDNEELLISLKSIRRELIINGIIE
jgi:hypothetical protein